MPRHLALNGRDRGGDAIRREYEWIAVSDGYPVADRWFRNFMRRLRGRHHIRTK